MIRYLQPRTVESMEQWLKLKVQLIKKGYSSYCKQYRAEAEEGLHVWFLKDEWRIEVVTHNKEIEEDLRKSKL